MKKRDAVINLLPVHHIRGRTWKISNRVVVLKKYPSKMEKAQHTGRLYLEPGVHATCECPGYAMGRKCKHIIALERRLDPLTVFEHLV